jgi:thymidylate kinase
MKINYQGPLVIKIGSNSKSVNTIEVFGLCGAGKSTVIKKLKLFLEQEKLEITASEPLQNHKLSAKHEILRIVINAMIIAPVQVLVFLLQSDARRWLFSKLAYRSMMSKQTQKKCHLLVDCGNYQPFVTYAIEIQELEKKIPVKFILPALPLPRAAIYFKVDKNIAQSRYEKREKNMRRLRRANKKQSDLSSLFIKGESVCEIIYKFLQDKNIKTYILDTEKSLSDEYLKSKMFEISEYIQS